MQVPIEQISELQRLEQTPPGGRVARRVRLLHRRFRLTWIVISALTSSVLVAQAFLGPMPTRIHMALLAGLALLLMIFLLQEERNARLNVGMQRFLWHRLRDLSQIFEVVLGVRSEEDVRLLFGLALQETMLLLRADYGVLLLHPENEEDYFSVLGFEDRQHDHRPWLLELEAMLLGLSVNTPIFVTDTEADPHFKSAELVTGMGVRSLSAVKFGTAERVMGVLVLGNAEPREYRTGDDKTLELCARLCSAIIRHGRKLDELEEQIQELKTDNDELTYSNQLKSEFASVASHELKTPLTAVKASVDALLGNVRKGDYADTEEFLLVIREEADRLIEMTGKILEISVLDYGNRVMERRGMRLRRIVDSCAQALEVHLQEKDMRLAREIPIDLPPVFADPGMIRQVLINLIGNAVKFSSAGQTVTVRAHSDGDTVAIDVVDEGIGIPEEEQPHIFERFYQGSRQGDHHAQSTGLGLAIVKQIVEQHQGQIGVRSEQNHGSIFTFHLPIARDSFGLEGSLLDLQPQGEAEEFLRLAVEWTAHVTRAEYATLLLAKGGGLEPFRTIDRTDGELDTEQACTLGAKAFKERVSALSCESDSEDEAGTTLAVPLNFNEQAVGCFVVARGEDCYRQEDLLLLEGIVARVARVLAHASEQNDSGKALRRAMHAVRDLIQSNGQSTPTRMDPGHLAWELSTRIGASRELARDIRLATNFHDVAMSQFGGDLGNEARSLSPNEQKKLRNHPRLAARLLEDIQAMEEVSRIVLHHHEWFDGRGYPDGLAGEEIPLGARLLAVIDAFCSMTAPRMYKPVRRTPEAARELLRFSGAQFDPEIVKHFIGLLGEKGWLEPEEAASLLQASEPPQTQAGGEDRTPSVVGSAADNPGDDGSA